MTLIYAYQDRGITHDITIKNTDGDTVIPGNSDKIRAIIGRQGEDPKLTVDSDAATANGSSFTKNSPSSGKNRLRLDASDLDFEPGTYTLFIDLFDANDDDEWKNIDRQVFVLEDS